MREIMEGTAARLAAENASAAEIALMDQVQADFTAATTPAEWAHFNKLFHDAIAGAVRNRYFHGPLEELQDSLALLGATTFAEEGRPVSAIDEHRRIFEAIAAHDPGAAEQAARDHIRSALATRLRMQNAAG
jgi:DNA-binding GntR family transcriptional regulator